METFKIAAKTFTPHVVKEISQRIQSAIQERGRCLIGLSGGSTPGPVYEALGLEKNIDWSRVTLCLIDDRYVPPHHKASNQLLVHQTLIDGLERVPQVILPDTLLPMDVCIVGYEYAISLALQDHGGNFDLLVLGMGDDGHIASLFPVLDHYSLTTKDLVLHTTTDRFDIHDRISLSPQALQRANAAILLLSAKKEGVLQQLQNSTEGPERWPLKFLEDRTTVFLQS